jgi:hypothetical protein
MAAFEPRDQGAKADKAGEAYEVPNGTQEITGS